MHDSIALLVIVAPLRASHIARCLIWLSVIDPDSLKIRLKSDRVTVSDIGSWPGTALPTPCP
jgi:hypothetical protein